MKKFTLLILIFISVALLAQDTGIWNSFRNSSYTAEDSLYVRFQALDIPLVNQEFYYSTADGWEVQEANLLSDFTFQNTIPYNSEQTTYCRVRTSIDSMTSLMPAFLESNAIPSSIDLMAKISDQATNDTLTTTYPHLDVVADYCAFSEDKIMVGIESYNQTYPTDSGGIFPSEYYFYISSIINLETALTDTVAYGIVYGNVPLFISPGLYRIMGDELSLDAFTQIGEVETAVVDGRLIMSCNMEDLTSDPHFGDWPSFSNTLVNANITARVALPTEFNLGDFGMPSMMLMKKFGIEPFENQLPQLSNLALESVGDNHTVTVDYYDENGNFPLTANLIQDGGDILEMTQLSLDYAETVTYTANFMSEPPVDFSVSFSDNNTDFVTLDNTDYEEEEIAAIFNLNNYPNPFNPTTTISFSTELHEQDEQIQIDIFNAKGQKIKSYPITSSTHSPIITVTWNGTDSNNNPVSSGIYFYSLKSGDKVVASSKMLLIK